MNALEKALEDVVAVSGTAGSNLDDDPFETAAKYNLDVVLPADDELFIDIDAPLDAEWLKLMVKVLHDNGWPVDTIKTTTSRNGNTHVYLHTLRPVTPVERIALQACLGSDRKRELLSLLRIIRELDRPATVFFEVRPEPALKGDDF